MLENCRELIRVSLFQLFAEIHLAECSLRGQISSRLVWRDDALISFIPLHPSLIPTMRAII